MLSLTCCLCAEPKQKKFAQPTELVAREGKTKAIRVTVGLFVWRKKGLYTVPWVQHSGKKITWTHVYGLGDFPIGLSPNGAVVCSLDLFLSV